MIESLGSAHHVHLAVEGLADPLVASLTERPAGETLTVSLPREALLLFDGDGRAIRKGDAIMATITIRDVARRAAVSVASASRALNNHSNVTPATRDRVLAAARALDYVPHLGARSLSRGRSNTIGVVLPDLFGEFFSEIIRGIDYAAHRRGLQLLLTNMHGSAEETEAAIRAMRGRVDGLLVMSPQVDADFLGRSLPKGLADDRDECRGRRHASDDRDRQSRRRARGGRASRRAGLQADRAHRRSARQCRRRCAPRRVRRGDAAARGP